MNERRTIRSRLATGGITAVAAFCLGITVLTSAAGWWSDWHAVILRLAVGIFVSVFGLLLGLAFSRKVAVGCLSTCLLVAIASFIGGFIGRQNAARLVSGLKDDNTVAQYVFRDETHRVSFRYPSNWESVPAQLEGTLVMLHARDGSFATSNLSVRSADRKTVDQMDEAYWKASLAQAFPDARIRDLRLIDAFGERRVILEYEFTLVTPSTQVPASSLTIATIRNGKRYMLILHAKRERIDTVRPIFDIMAGTLMFDREY